MSGGGGDARFGAACASLAGTTAIDPALVAAAQVALEAGLGRAAVDALVEAVTSSQGETLPPVLEGMARQLLTILYTGQVTVGTDGGPSQFYGSALAWKVLGFASTPGRCGPEDWPTEPAR